jgi:hypothetical protein
MERGLAPASIVDSRWHDSDDCTFIVRFTGVTIITIAMLGSASNDEAVPVAGSF